MMLTNGLTSLERSVSHQTLATIKNRNNMKRAFVYKDEKSHKFWWIDYSDCVVLL